MEQVGQCSQTGVKVAEWSGWWARVRFCNGLGHGKVFEFRSTGMGKDWVAIMIGI